LPIWAKIDVFVPIRVDTNFLRECKKNVIKYTNVKEKSYFVVLNDKIKL